MGDAIKGVAHRIWYAVVEEGLISQGSSGLIVLAASLAGAPISTSDVVAPAVVGVGSGERWRHVSFTTANAAASTITTRSTGRSSHGPPARDGQSGSSLTLCTGRTCRYLQPVPSGNVRLLGDGYADH
jgi:hypothetical protein